MNSQIFESRASSSDLFSSSYEIRFCEKEESELKIGEFRNFSKFLNFFFEILNSRFLRDLSALKESLQAEF